MVKRSLWRPERNIWDVKGLWGPTKISGRSARVLRVKKKCTISNRHGWTKKVLDIPILGTSRGDVGGPKASLEVWKGPADWWRLRFALDHGRNLEGQTRLLCWGVLLPFFEGTLSIPLGAPFLQGRGTVAQIHLSLISTLPLRVASIVHLGVAPGHGKGRSY